MSTFFRSAAVGATATGADLVALSALVWGVGLSPSQANLPALTVGLAVQFAGNKWVAFGDRSAAVARQGGLFLAAEAVGLALSATLFHTLVAVHVPVLASRLLASAVVYATYSYPVFRRIFGASPAAQGEAS
jgi:putative flippase GtrA